MAPVGHDAHWTEDVASVGDASWRDNAVINRDMDDQHQPDDHVRSWLEATSSSTQEPVSPNGTNHSESIFHSAASDGEPSNIIERGGSPPPYTVHDPAIVPVDYSSTYEFDLDDNNQANAKLYTPLYLRAWVFVVFSFVFALMLIAVEVMYQMARRCGGLGTSDEDNHYLWTYGPTLFLTIVAAFWGQVEYRVKQLMPWKVMTKGPVPADEALLMDYVTSWNVMALFSSLKSKHIGVSLAVLGSLLIKLAIVFSTGFLSLQRLRRFEDGTFMQLHDDFSAFGSGNNSYIQPLITAIAVSQYGVSYPPGTTETFAVQSFSSVQNISDPSSILLAKVDAFSADLKCEVAGVSHVSGAQCTGLGADGSCDTVSYNLTVSSSTCITNTSYISVAMNDTRNQYYGSVTAGFCLGQPIDGGNNRRYTFVTGLQPISYSNGAKSALQSTAIICKPIYQVCRVPVSLYLNGTIERVMGRNRSCSTIDGVSTWDVGTAVMESVDFASTSTLAGLNTFDTGYGGSSATFDNFFRAMNATSLPSNLTDFANITYLDTSARHLFSLIAAQTAKARLMSPAFWQIPGTLIAYEQRLFVREVSLRLLESIFAMMIAISLVTLLLRPSSSTPSDVSTMAGIATVLSRSPRTVMALQGLGSNGVRNMKQRLKSKTCQSVIVNESTNPVFRLMTTSGAEDTAEPTTSDSIRWWQPLFMTIHARIALVILPLALIAALEALYQVSHKHFGLDNVDESNAYHFIWTYVPAFVMLVIQTLFQEVDFNTRVFQPFETLREAPHIADRTINVNYLSYISPRCIWKAYQRRHYAVLITSIIMLIAPLLTVVASGLYSPDTVENYIATSVKLNDTINNVVAWNASGSNSPGDAITVSTLITEANMSYPAWTYNGYVLPKLDTSGFFQAQSGDSSTANTTTVQVTMPAVYAVLNCTYVTPVITREQNSNRANVSVPVPLGCGDECANDDFNVTHVCDTSKSSSLSLPNGLTIKEGIADYGRIYVPNGEYRDIPQHCPQLALVYGQAMWDSSSSTINLDIGAAVCSPVIYSVTLNTTFIMPGFVIDSIERDESAVEIVAYGGVNNATLGIDSWLPPTNWGVQGFYGGLVPGRNGLGWEDLIGEDNFPKFSAAVDDLYSILYTQWLNIYGRTSVPAHTGHLKAMVMDPLRLRLKQSAISTRILEALLAVIAILVAVSFFLLDTRKLLPCNPCSIGAMSALLAESEMLKIVPEGAEWYDRKELARKRVFTEYLFTLSWFEGLGGVKRYGVDVGSAARANDR